MALYPGPPQFIRFLTGWRQSLARMIPVWMSQRPNAQNGFRWLWSMILPLDVELELMLQSVNDWAPGSPNASETARPLICNSRGLLQGEAETGAHCDARLQQWRAINRQRGKSTRLAQEIQNYLGNNPLVRVIEREYSAPGSGTPTANYCTAHTDGTTAEQVAAWDWDSKLGWTDDATTWSGDQCRGFWSDSWIVVYPGEWGLGNTVTPLTGLQIPAKTAADIARIVRDWKGAHVFIRSIIFSYDATLFDPANPGATGNPDGTWGNWGKDDGSGNQIVSRNLTGARYWDPVRGGG